MRRFVDPLPAVPSLKGIETMSARELAVVTRSIEDALRQTRRLPQSRPMMERRKLLLDTREQVMGFVRLRRSEEEAEQRKTEERLIDRLLFVIASTFGKEAAAEAMKKATAGKSLEMEYLPSDCEECPLCGAVQDD